MAPQNILLVGIGILVSLGLAEQISLGCTANDTTLVGPGIILNEPCSCSGTFPATIQFQLSNGAGTNRYCVLAHLCPVPPPPDLHELTDAPLHLADSIAPKTISPVTLSIPDYPCGAGTVCFGAVPVINNNKITCPSGQCCSTITWNPKPATEIACPDPKGYVPSKCGIQQICIQGRPSATLTCVSGSCQQPCGGTMDLQLCPTSDALKPYTFSLNFNPSGSGQIITSSAITVGGIGCTKYTVQITQDTTAVGTVTSNDNCPKTASQALTVTPEAQITGITQSSTSCNGTVTFSVQGASDASSAAVYTWRLNGTPVAGVTGRDYTFNPRSLSDIGTCLTVNVTGNDNGCSLGSASSNFKQCLSTNSC